MKREIRIHTAKYFRSAIKQYSIYLRNLRDRISDTSTVNALSNILDFHCEIAKKIDNYHLDYRDPNRHFEGEPYDINLNLNEKEVIHLTQLVVRMLKDWRCALERVKANKFRTEKNIEETFHFEYLIHSLEALFNDSGTIFHTYQHLGPLIFPGETNQPMFKMSGKINTALRTIGNQLVDMREGMWAALKSDQSDAGRQAVHSARELISQVLKEGAPSSLETRKERARFLISKYRNINVSGADLSIISISCELIEAEHSKFSKLAHARSSVDIDEARGSVQAAERVLNLLFGFEDKEDSHD